MNEARKATWWHWLAAVGFVVTWMLMLGHFPVFADAVFAVIETILELLWALLAPLVKLIWAVLEFLWAFLEALRDKLRPLF